MEDSSSSQLNTAFSTLGIRDSSVPQPLKFIMNNINHIVRTQLDHENYLWKSQVLKLVRANDFEGFLNGEIICPPRTLPDAQGQLQPNPAYKAWQMVDQNLASAICSIISSSILPYVINLHSTLEIWQTVERRLQATNRSRIIQLKNELHNVSMRTQTLAQYLTQIKTIVDNLAAAKVQIDPEDIILYNLNGLPAQFQSFKTFIRNQLTPLSLDDFYSLLCSEEINLDKEFSAPTLPTDSTNTALYTTRGRGHHNFQHSRDHENFTAGRCNPSSQSTVHNNSVHCQICLKSGHTAMQCWHRLNANYIPSAPPTPTALTASATDPSTTWFVDSGAVTHLTNNYDYLQQPQPYQGEEQIHVGNGSSASIQHTGHGLLPTPQHKLYYPIFSTLHNSHTTYSLFLTSPPTTNAI